MNLLIFSLIPLRTSRITLAFSLIYSHIFGAHSLSPHPLHLRSPLPSNPPVVLFFTLCPPPTSPTEIVFSLRCALPPTCPPSYCILFPPIPRSAVPTPQPFPTSLLDHRPLRPTHSVSLPTRVSSSRLHPHPPTTVTLICVSVCLYVYICFVCTSIDAGMTTWFDLFLSVSMSRGDHSHYLYGTMCRPKN